MRVDWNARFHAASFLLGKSWYTSHRLAAAMNIKPIPAWQLLHAMEAEGLLEKRLKQGKRYCYEWRLNANGEMENNK
jgi:hypothetical protein